VFTLDFAPETIDHLDAIERKYHRLIEKMIDGQLRHTPDQETRNRKPLERPTSFGATWELRFGANNRFRVFMKWTRQNRRYGYWLLARKRGISYSSVERRF
jgi:hypothetical protein